MINSICIVRLSALGDVLMLVPLVRTLQAHLPKASITWIISRPAYDLVEGLTGIEFIVIDKPNNLKDYLRFKKMMKSKAFDVLLAAQASFRANLLYACIKAKRKIGYDALRAKDGHGWFIRERIQPGNDHTLEGFLKFATALSITPPVIAWDLPIGPAAKQWAAQYQFVQPTLIVNPAASKPERSWAIEKYIELIQYAQNNWGMKVILTGGPGEYDRVLANSILAKIACIDLVGKTKPKQLLALIQQATLVICPDTGPSHMAAAVNTPVIALHAVTSAAVSGPYLFRHFAVDVYPQAVEIILKKSLTENIWGTHVHGHEAMQLISTEMVLKQLDAFMLQFTGGAGDKG